MNTTATMGLRRALIAATTAAAIGFGGVAQAKVTWNFNMFGPKRALTAGI